MPGKVAPALRSLLGVRLMGQIASYRRRGRRVPYDAQAAWNVRYEGYGEGGIDDVTTIRRGADPRLTLYHYNTVENAILEHALQAPFPERPTVLDIGSGAGHWIDFYRSAFAARRVVGLELSAPAADALRSRYAGEDSVSVEQGDVSGSLDLGERFEIVNAVDVLFHIVDDGLWRRAMANLAAHVAPGGRLVIAEHVALVPYDAGLRPPDPKRGEPAENGVLMVTKRVRSLRDWRSCGEENGLSLEHTSPLRQSRTLSTPANRLLVFRPARG